MKKIISLIVAVVIIMASFSGCQNNEEKESDADKKPVVVATIFPFYDFAKNIVKDKMDIKMLVEPGKSSHDYKSNIDLADITLVHNSDMFIYCGGETDEFIEESDGFKDKDLSTVVCAMDEVQTYDEELVEGMQEEEHDDEEHDEDAPETDEHIWTNPLNVIKICSKITEVAKKIDPENASFYDANYKEYCEKLTKLDESFENMVNSSKRKTIVIADRFPFRYLTERYSLEYFAAFPGCSSSGEASLATISFLVNKVKTEELPAVFYTDGSTMSICNQVSKETGAKALLLHSCHDLTQEEFESGEDYISLMNKNLTNLSEALN